MFLLVIGCIVLLLVPAGLAVHRSALRDLRTVREATELTSQEMRSLAAPSLVAFTGHAGGPPVTTYLGSASCVWFRYQVIEHYQVLRSSEIGSRWYSKTQVVVQHSAPEWITLRDEHGCVSCDLRVTDGDQPTGLDEVFRRKEHPSVFGIEVPPSNRDGRKSRTTGYELREWVIRPGQQLHVIGEFAYSGSTPTIGRPRDDRRFLISAWSGDELDDKARRRTATNLGCLIITAVLGLTLVTLGLVIT